MYRIKHTGEQVDRLLKDVFDSTLQTKDIDVTENAVIEVTPDEGYLGLAKVNVNVDVPTEGGGSSVEADDIIYIAAAYFNGAFNLSKATLIVGFGVDIEEISIKDDSTVVDFISEYLSYGGVYMSIKNEKILTYSSSSTNYVCADSGIKVVGVRYIDDVSDETEEFEGTLIYQAADGRIGINVNNSFIISMSNVIKIKKIIASNGIEYISEQE